jgi:hypothetical protein
MSHRPRGSKGILLLAALLVAGPAGCALWDQSQVPVISPAGTIRTRGMVKVRVDCAGASEGEFVLDGAPFGKRFKVGEETDLDLHGKADGTYQVEARVFVGTTVRRSAPMVVELDASPPRLVRASPMDRSIYVRPPAPLFTATLEFDEPLSPDGLEPGLTYLVADGLPSMGFVASLEDSGKRLVLAADATLLEAQRIEAHVWAEDSLGNTSLQIMEWSWNPGLYVTLWSPSRPTWSPGLDPQVWGAIDIVGQWSQPTFGDLDLLIDGTWVGRVSSGSRYRWDASLVADGVHTLTFSAPAARPNVFSVTVNNGPRLKACVALAGTLADGSVKGGILATFDRPVGVSYPSGNPPWCGEAFCLVGSDASRRPSEQVVALPVPGPLPVDVTFTFDPVLDSFGRHVLPGQTCSAHFPPWRRPLDPVTAGDGALGSASLISSGRATDLGASGQLLRIAPPGSPAAGSVQRLAAAWDRAAGAPWEVLDADLRADGTAVASQLVGDTWLEAGPGGTTLQQYRSATRYSSPPLDPAAAPYRLLRGDDVGWIEQRRGAGQLGFASTIFGSPMVPVAPLVAPTPGGSIVEGSVANPPTSWPNAAVVEEVGGAPGTLSTWQFDYGLGQWRQTAAALNSDPTRTPSQPLLWQPDNAVESYLAWVEEGKVWVRSLPWTLDWSPPVLANSSAGAVATLPRISGPPLDGSVLDYSPRLTFVERGPSGDSIEVRKLNTWCCSTVSVVLEPLASFHTGGTIADLSVAGGAPLAILVTFDTGEVTLLVYNE